MSDVAECIRRLRGAGQDHILDILEHGNEKDRSALVKQLTVELHGVDFYHLNHVLRQSLEHCADHNSTAEMEPPPDNFLFDALEARRSGDKCVGELEKLGYEAIHAGRVAFLILAGGSGTRLGATVPKGLFTCKGLREGKSLFQIHSEKILRREELATSRCGGAPSAKIQLLVMTSTQNDEQTRRFFQEANYFGLAEEQVHFFLQASLPCYDEDTGRVLMESSNRISAAPGGNAGVYPALMNVPQGAKESLMQRLERLGVTYVQIGNVDNLITKVADPLFAGYALKEEAHVVVKACPKARPDEAVGVFARVREKWGVVEYTEIGERAAEVHAATGELKFNCANISSYICSVRFLQLAADRMKSFTRYHVARKKIPTVNGPTLGIKLEAFIFDLFRYAKECVNPAVGGGDGFRIMQVDRSEEFAPIKNAEGAASDTASDASRLLWTLHTRWLSAALSSASAGGGEDAQAAAAALAALRRKKVAVEISPLVSSEGEGLKPYLPCVVRELLSDSCDRVVIRRPDEAPRNPSNV
ncbi:UDP-sugar pyrophosphorylase [Trypanosoma conorhini]|uniref:UDP-N-acetylglucosamine diphosphorylase n=1 Tax=Trypanosoma conorhini TaxID=83891 RepID=A0A3R7N8B9_9TRYP|nr:UDP-sugar pyrophosphorylase [Trypanosoma conorhini]RNF17953.1 UDP-sugar pyrophosphorylase [Trypanosoma conorhini]